MGKLIKLAGTLFAWFCMATVIAAAAGGGYLASTGKLNPDKWFRILAVVHDVDLTPPQEKHAPQEDGKAGDDHNPAGHAQQVHLLRSLDQDLRDQALEKGLLDLKTLESNLKEERRRYDQLKSSFDKALAELEQNAKATGVIETQRTLEVVSPKQAKDQILKMVTDGAMNDVVTILKGMAIEKRKKIFAEFKENAETEKLYEILKQIRSGDPEKRLISDTRRDIQQPPGNL